MRILVVRVGALGDVLLLRRAVCALRRAGHDVTLMAPSAAGPVLVGSGAFEAGDLLAWEAPDVAELLSGGATPESALAERLSRFDAAFAFTRNATLIERLRRLVPCVVVRDPEPGATMHASLWLAGAVAALGCAAGPEPPVLVATPDEAAAAARLASPLREGFLAIHPGSGSARKNWLPERFAAVVRALADDRAWLLVEGPADREAVASVREAAANAVVARELPPRVLGGLLAGAGLYVGNDSGVSHLAAAFGAPTLALFGPTDPALWSPVGPRVKTLRGGGAALETLAAAQVVDAARSWVERPSG